MHQAHRSTVAPGPLASSLVALALAVGAAACSTGVVEDPGTDPELGPEPTSEPPSETTERPPTRTVTPDPPPVEPPPPPPPTDPGYVEVVEVLMLDGRGGGWMCTGTAVSDRRVVTAAHCLDKEFVSYEIRATNAPGRPRISARNPRIFGGSYEQVENPDIGTLDLDRPLTLPVYATLTDVVADVEASAGVLGVAHIRTAPRSGSTFASTGPLAVRSTVPIGYLHGFGTPLFSKGGDSGAGLFLHENGKNTHKLIAVCRQPDPESNEDHLTRIDADFLAWFHGA